MKKILLLFFALVTVCAGTMAQTNLSITFPMTDQTQVSAYSCNWTGKDVNGDTWRLVNFNNNKNGWNYIRCGWKTAATTSVISSPLIAEAVTDYSIIVDKTSGVTSAKLEVLKSDSATVIETKNVTFAAGTVKVTLTGSKNAYYRLTIENEKVSSNGTTQISGLTLTKAASEDTATKPDLTTGGIFTTTPYSVTITNKESGSTVYYTMDGTDPTTESSSFTGESKTLSIEATTTIKAMSVISGKSNSAIASATYTYEESIANTAETAYTVAQIKDIIDAGSAQLKTTELFVKGKVSQVDSYNSTYGSITYWISDDGETASQQFEVYGGLSFDGGKFTAISDIQVGDEVIVKGLATFYSSKSIYEFNQNSTLIYRTEHTKKTPTLTATYQTKLNVNETDNVVVSYDGDGAVSISSSNPDVADVDGGEGSTTYIGAYTEGSTTITISAPETDKYYAASLKYTLKVVTPMGGLETFTNGGFETWTSTSEATGWKSSTTASNATVSQSTDARNGQYSAKVAGATSGNKRLGSKEFKLSAGYYTFEAYAKAANAEETPKVAAGFVGAVLQDDGSYKTTSNYVYGDYFTVDNSAWTRIYRTVYLDQDTVVNVVVMNNKAPGKDVLIDDAVLREATAEEIDQMTGVATFEYTPTEMAEESVYYYESEDPTTTPSVTWKSGNRFTFSTYTAVYGAYKYYYAYAISNKTTTDGKLSDYALESACGGAKNGSKYAVWYDNSYNGGSKITLSSAGKVNGFYVTNTTSVVDAILNGDGMSKVAGSFQNGDSLTLVITGYDAEDVKTDTVAYKLAYAQEGTIYYVKDWRWVDLNALGSVASIEMKLTSTKTNDYGATTPLYFCMDDFGGTKPETDAEMASQPIKTGIKGDVNCDGEVDVADVTAILSVMFGSEEHKDTADVNGDGEVDVADATAVLGVMYGTKE